MVHRSEMCAYSTSKNTFMGVWHKCIKMRRWSAAKKLAVMLGLVVGPLDFSKIPLCHSADSCGLFLPQTPVGICIDWENLVRADFVELLLVQTLWTFLLLIHMHHPFSFTHIPDMFREQISAQSRVSSEYHSKI